MSAPQEGTVEVSVRRLYGFAGMRWEWKVLVTMSFSDDGTIRPWTAEVAYGYAVTLRSAHRKADRAVRRHERQATAPRETRQVTW